MTVTGPTRRPETAPSIVGGAAAVRRVGYVLSILLLVVSCTLAAPLAVAAGYGEDHTVAAFATTLFIGVAVSVSGLFLLRTDLSGISRREGFAIVALGWLLAVLLSSVPYVLSGVLGPVDAWFECMSGYSGTGASVIADVEALPKGILFWRSFAHWLGGMGFVVLSVALFPLLGVGAMRLYRAEAPGMEVDRLRPRISSTARVLWLMYLGISVVLTVLLLLGGMSWLDALCQMFAVLGTGGLSSKNLSIAAFDSAYIDWILALFMWICACNFSLHWMLLTGKPGKLLRNTEWQVFALLMAGSGVFLGVLAWITTDTALADALREGIFVAVSTGSTTGFSLADYELWAPVSQFLIVILMFIGGCAGSTAGGIKIVRTHLFVRQSLLGFFRTLHPSAVSSPRLEGRPVTTEMMRSVSTFVGLYLFMFVAGSAAVSLAGLDFATATSATASMLGNIGPGLGAVGPFDNYAWIHPGGKLVLSFLMLAGRLELFTVLIFFSPAFWRR